MNTSPLKNSNMKNNNIRGRIEDRLVQDANMRTRAIYKEGDINLEKEFFTVLKGTLNEVDWAKFETRVRQLVQEITEPLAMKTNTYKVLCEKYRKEQDILCRKINECDFQMKTV